MGILRAGLLAAAVLPLLVPMSVASPAAPAPAPAGAEERNVLLVIVDDMRTDELRVMPKTQAWLQQHGVRFANAYAPTPLCCPARASILTGQYTHNHGVQDNNETLPHPGGVSVFDDDLTLATQVDDAVTTGYIGKYLNRYGQPDGVDASYVPPGWDRWWAATGGEYTYLPATTYTVDGIRPVRLEGYQTDVATQLAQNFIRRHRDQPFLLVLNYLAPHSNVDPDTLGKDRPVPAPEYRGDFAGTGVPRTRAFNERNVSDKPESYQRPRLSSGIVRRLDRLADARYETLQSVDEGMARLRRSLRADGLLAATDVIFVSDNGFMLGEHRLPASKVVQYEPSVRVPMLMAGPDVPVGEVRSDLVGLHDLASTITTWFGLGPMPGADGIDLGQTMVGDPSGRDLLFEGYFDTSPERDYATIRTPAGLKYTELVNGQRELYDLTVDPYETQNLVDRPELAATVADLAARLAVLRACAEQTCR